MTRAGKGYRSVAQNLIKNIFYKGLYTALFPSHYLIMSPIEKLIVEWTF